MGWRALDRLIPVLAIVAAAVVIYDGYRLVRASQLNAVLPNVEEGELPHGSHPRLLFARAYALQQAGSFDEAVKAYAGIDAGSDDRLRADIGYNLANLYFRRGLQFLEDDADDLAMPLIELAKEGYRDLLRAGTGGWSARYNLELALRLAPESELEAVEEERNPEHNPRSAAGIQVSKPLP